MTGVWWSGFAVGFGVALAFTSVGLYFAWRRQQHRQRRRLRALKVRLNSIYGKTSFHSERVEVVPNIVPRTERGAMRSFRRIFLLPDKSTHYDVVSAYPNPDWHPDGDR